MTRRQGDLSHTEAASGAGHDLTEGEWSLSTQGDLSLTETASGAGQDLIEGEWSLSTG